MNDLEKYLDDLDNLIDTGWFPQVSVKDCTFYHKDLTLRDFVSKGREYIRQYSMVGKEVNEPHEVSLVKCDLCGFEWIAVRPLGLDKLECKQCGNMVHFENIG